MNSSSSEEELVFIILSKKDNEEDVLVKAPLCEARIGKESCSAPLLALRSLNSVV